MGDIAITICILALVAVVGLWIGHWKIRGVGLGIGGGIIWRDYCCSFYEPKWNKIGRAYPTFYSRVWFDPICLHYWYSSGPRFFRIPTLCRPKT